VQQRASGPGFRETVDWRPERIFILLALFQDSGWSGNIDPQLTYPRDFQVDDARVDARDDK
jgi:hypothetical protein